MRFSDGDVEWAGCTGLGAGRGLGWRQKFATRVHMAVETPGVEESPREGVHREEGWQAGIGVHSFSSTRVFQHQRYGCFRLDSSWLWGHPCTIGYVAHPWPLPTRYW